MIPSRKKMGQDYSTTKKEEDESPVSLAGGGNGGLVLETLGGGWGGGGGLGGGEPIGRSREEAGSELQRLTRAKKGKKGKGRKVWENRGNLVRHNNTKKNIMER